MTIPFEKMLQETFKDLQNLTPEKLQALIQETMKVFTTLQEKTQSPNPKDQEEALLAVLSLKDTLEVQAEEVCKKMGMDVLQLASFSDNSANFTEKEWEELSGIKRELETFREQFALPVDKNKAPIKKAKKGSRKGPKTWLVG